MRNDCLWVEQEISPLRDKDKEENCKKKNKRKKEDFLKKNSSKYPRVQSNVILKGRGGTGFIWKRDQYLSVVQDIKSINKLKQTNVTDRVKIMVNAWNLKTAPTVVRWLANTSRGYFRYFSGDKPQWESR